MICIGSMFSGGRKKGILDPRLKMFSTSVYRGQRGVVLFKAWTWNGEGFLSTRQKRFICAGIERFHDFSESGVSEPDSARAWTKNPVSSWAPVWA